MADDLGVQFFTAAKAQHEASAKWHLIVLVLLAYFHLALAGPFAEKTEDLRDTFKARDEKRILESQLADVVQRTSAFTSLVQQQVGETAGALREDLVNGFGALDAIIPELIRLGPKKAEGEDGARLFQTTSMTGMQQQQQQSPQPEALDQTLLMPPALRVLVAKSEIGNVRELAEMKAYVSSSIVEPAIQRANESWARHRQAILATEKEIGEQIQSIKVTGDGAASLQQLQTTVLKLSEAVGALEFVAPEDPEWWSTVGGKDASIQKMLEAMTNSIDEKRRAIEEVNNQAVEAAEATQENERHAQDLAAELAGLEKEAADLQAQLSVIGDPLKVISLKLPLLVPLLALIIGLGVAAIALWRAESLRRMSAAASVVADAAQDRVVRSWLRSAAGGSPARLLAWEIASGAAAVAWVVVAWNVTRSLPEPLLPSVAVIGLALAAVAAAWAYHWYRASQALAISERK